MTPAELSAALKAELDTKTYRALTEVVAAKVAAADAAGYARAQALRPWPVLVADTLRGLSRSWTGWVGGLLLTLPELLPAIEKDLPGLLGEQAANRVMQIAGLLMILLRLKTTGALWNKGLQKSN